MGDVLIRNVEEYASSFVGEAKLGCGSSFTVVVQRNPEAQSSNSGDVKMIGTTDTGGKEAYVVFTVKSMTERRGPTGANEEVPSVTTCKSCGKEIGPPANFGALYSHSLHCSREDLHKCNICLKRFHRKSALTKHLFAEHGIKRTEKVIACEFCGKGFDKKQLLVKHLKRTKCGLSAAAKGCAITSDKRELSVAAQTQAVKTGSTRGYPESKTPEDSHCLQKGHASGEECKPKAMVNHDGHIDWLLSCDTLMCSDGNHKRSSEEDPEQKFAHHGHQCVSVPKGGRKRARTLSLGLSDVTGEFSYGVDDCLSHCPLGCELATTGCEHIEGARLVKHNGHWDHVIDDHLFHIFETEDGGVGMVDHGAFEIMDSNLDFM